MIHNLSIKIGETISLKLRLDERTKALVQYGAELFISYMSEIIAIIIIAALIGMLNYSIPILIAVNIYTFILGNIHASTYLKCFLISVLTYTFLPWISMFFIPMLPLSSLRIFAVLTAVYSIYVIHRYALLPGHNKRVKSEDQRNKLKKMSYLYIAVWNIVVLLTSYLSQNKDIILPAFATTWGLLFQSIIFTPQGRKLFVKVDKLLG